MWAFYTHKTKARYENYVVGWSMHREEAILAIDPGSEKCGLAVVEGEAVILHEVVTRSQLLELVKEVMPNSGPIILGDRTGSKQFHQELRISLPEITERIILIDEHLSSVEARTMYWQYNPPTGWRRLLPVSLQVPPVPIDDYVAIILARRYQKLMVGD